MSPVTPNDVFNLDEEDETEIAEKNLQQHYFHEILSGETIIRVIHKCEGCGDALRTPMVVLVSTSDDDDDERDSSILCDAKCA